MKIFKIIEIDLAPIRAKVNQPRLFNKRQRAALHKLYDLFEAGKWQECLNHVRDKEAFPRNNYPETEHIATEVSDVLRELSYEIFITRDELLAQARELIAKEQQPTERADSLKLKIGDRVRVLAPGPIWRDREGEVVECISDVTFGGEYGVSVVGLENVRYFTRTELDYLP